MAIIIRRNGYRYQSGTEINIQSLSRIRLTSFTNYHPFLSKLAKTNFLLPAVLLLASCCTSVPLSDFLSLTFPINRPERRP